jgi:hypothetical protein
MTPYLLHVNTNYANSNGIALFSILHVYDPLTSEVVSTMNICGVLLVLSCITALLITIWYEY